MIDNGYNLHHLYRYIKQRNGKYLILKDNIDYGTYNKLEDALLERDILEDCNWNQEIVISNATITQNRYKEYDLPPFPKTRNKILPLPRYISYNGTSYIIQKRINKEVKFFGSYHTLKEAKNIKRKLMKNNWDEKVLKEHRKQAVLL